MNRLSEIIGEEVKKFLNENDFTDVHDYYEEYDDAFREILTQMINGDTTKIVLKKIKPQMYQQALNEFVKYGQIMRYPTKYIYDWKDIVIRNTIFLDVNTMFYGHTSYFDVDTFNDYVFNTDETGESVQNWSEAWEYMEEKGYVDVLEEFMPKFSNGHDLISDFGLRPLMEVVKQLMETQDPNQILVLINKALDISHQRSDLSELFIEGGEMSLDRISGTNESVLRIVGEEVKKFLNEEDYRGEHGAPESEGGAPLYDATNAFGEDIYGPDAVRYFGTHSPYDGFSVAVIKSARNKPHQRVKIYRAVPKVITNQEKIIDYENRKKYVLKTGRLPRDVTNWSNSSEYYDWLSDELENLKSEPETAEEKVKINNGDWVTINPQYAKEHGQNNLKNNYRVLTKTVTANQLFTDGDIHEWGYNTT